MTTYDAEIQDERVLNVFSGQLGYLREADRGGLLATKVLVPESFDATLRVEVIVSQGVVYEPRGVAA